MGISFNHPLLLLLLPVLLFPVFLWFREASVLKSSRRFLIAILRVVILLSLLLALAGLEIRFPLKNQAVVFVVDLSASCEKGRELAEDFIKKAIKHKGPDDMVGTVVFGGDAGVEQPLTRTPGFERLESIVDRNYSNIGDGLRMAQALMAQDYLKRVVLISDGRENRGDGVEEAMQLAQRDLRVDVFPLQLSEGPEVRLESLSVPDKLFAKEKFQLQVKVSSNTNTAMVLRIYQDKTLLAEEHGQVSSGDNLFVYSATASGAGLHTFRAVVEAGQDTLAENNEAHAFTMVKGSPKVLLVEGLPGEGTAIRSALQSLNLSLEVVSPERVPLTLAELNQFASVILCNVPAETLKSETMEAIHTAVKDLGMGLVMVGGDQSFGPGGYFKTPLEKALPVHMDLRGKAEMPSLGLVLVIDKSGSMSAEAGGFSKIDLAREAAIQATGVLGPLDQIGVIAFDEEAQWVVKMQGVDDLNAIQDDIATIRAGGGD